jgi:hypothetical protein
MSEIIRKTKFLLLALVGLAAGGAWAAMLSYSGYVPVGEANKTTVFSGVRLSDIGTTLVLSGNVGGGWVDNDGAATVCNTSSDNGGLTVQFQCVDAGYCKVVEVVFIQDGNDIKAYSRRSGYQQNGSVGTTSITWRDVGSDVAGSSGADGYGAYGIALATPDELTATLAYNGNFPNVNNTTVNGVTFYPKNGNSSVTDGIITVGSGTATPAPAGSFTDCGYASIVFKADFTNVTPAAGMMLVSFGTTANHCHCGIVLKSAGNGQFYCSGVWKDGAWTTIDDSSNTFTLTGEKTFLATYDQGSGSTRGTALYVFENGKKKTLYTGFVGNSALKGGTVARFGVGGAYGTSGSFSRVAGMKLKALSLFLSSTNLPITADDNFAACLSSETVASGTTVSLSELNAKAPCRVTVESGSTINIDTTPSRDIEWHGAFLMNGEYVISSGVTVNLKAGGKARMHYTAATSTLDSIEDGASLVLAGDTANTGSLAATLPAGANADALNVTVIRKDGGYCQGTWDGNGAYTYNSIINTAICGSSTGLDYTFTNTTTAAYFNGTEYLNKDAPFVFNNTYADKTTGLYARAYPYAESANIKTYIQNHSGALTLVVVATAPETTNTQFMHMGRSNDGHVGILFSTGTEANKIVISYNKGKVVYPITTMTVPNAATARHVYAITKRDFTNANSEEKTTFTVYLDGTPWKSLTIDKLAFTNNSGIQCGSDFGGQIHQYAQDANGNSVKNLYKRIASNDTSSVLNAIRLFGSVLDETTIKGFSASEEYPYNSPYGDSERAFAADGNWIETSSAPWTVKPNGGAEATSGAPLDGSNIKISSSVAGGATVSVNLDEDKTYEALTITGNPIAFEFAEGKAGVIKATGAITIGAETTIKAGALEVGGATTILDNGVARLIFDYSDYDATGVTVVNPQVTPLVLASMDEQTEGKVTCTVPTTPHRAYSFGYANGGYNLSITAYQATLTRSAATIDVDTFVNAFNGAIDGDIVGINEDVTVSGLSVDKNLTIDTGANTLNAGAITVTAGSLVFPSETVTYTLGSGTAVDQSYTGTGVKLINVADAAASVTLNAATSYYSVLGDAITAFGTNAGTLTLLADTNTGITLSAGQTLDVGSTTYGGTVSAASGSVVGCVGGVYTSYADTTGETWTGTANNGNWKTAANWDKGFVPLSTTPVTFPAGDSTITLATANGSETCASITLNGNLTLQYSGGSWVEFYMFGGVSGTGTLTLSHVCLNNRTNGEIDISSPVEIAAVSGDSAFLGTGSWTISGPLTVNGYFKAQNTPVTVSGETTFAASGVTVETQAAITFTGNTTLNGGFSHDTSYGGAMLTFGDVTVAASTAIAGSRPNTFVGMVTLEEEASLTVTTSATTVTDATFATTVEGSYVKSETSGSTTIYSIETLKTVTFYDEDGETVLQTVGNLRIGDTPAYTEATPTKATTAQYTYTFTGWDPEITTVSGNDTYRATYSSTVNEYTITWKNDDGSTIDTTVVAYGDTPTHADASKAATAQYTYTFSGWDPAIATVTGDAEYTAQFSSTVNNYKVTIPAVEHASTVVVTIGAVVVPLEDGGYTVPYGSEVTITYTADEGYFFGTSKTKVVEIASVEGDTVVTAEQAGSTSAAEAQGSNNKYYPSLSAGLGWLYSNLSTPDVYLQVLPAGEASASNTLGGMGIGYDATNKVYAKAVAIVGDAGYLTVQEAIGEAANEDTVVLKANSEEVLTLANGKTVTITDTVGANTYTYTPPVPVTAGAYTIDVTPTETGATYTARDWYTWTVTVDAEHATVTGITSPVSEANRTINFTVLPDTYYSVATVTANGTELTPVNDKYSYALTGDVTIEVTATRDQVTVTVPEVIGTTVSVTYTEGGVEQHAAAAGAYTVDKGTAVTVAWTASDNYAVTDGTTNFTATENVTVGSAGAGSLPTVKATAATWIGYTEGNYNVAANWSSGIVPTKETVVTIPAGDYTIRAKLDENHCKAMVLIGNVTLTSTSDQGNNRHFIFWGDNGVAVSGSGTLKLAHYQIFNANTSGNLEIQSNLVLLRNGEGPSQFSGNGSGSFTVTGKTTTDGLTGSSVNVEATNGRTLTFADIDVPSGSELRFVRNNSSYYNITGTVTLAPGPNTSSRTKLTANDHTTVSGSVVTTGDYYVKAATSSITRSYTAWENPVVTVTSDAHVAVTGVMDGQQVAPGTVLTITVTPEENYVATLTVDSNTVIDGSAVAASYNYTMTESDVTIAATSALNTTTFTVTVPAHATIVSVSNATDNGDGTYTATIGATVTVTFAAAEGYFLSGETTKSVTATAGMEPIEADSSMVVNATVAKIGDTPYASLQAALDAVKVANTVTPVVDLVGNATLELSKTGNVLGGSAATSIMINGNGNTLTFVKSETWAQVNTANNAELVLNNVVLAAENSTNFAKSGYNNDLENPNHNIAFNCPVELNNVTSGTALSFFKDATLDKVTVAETVDVYSIWIHTSASAINIKDLVVNTSTGRGIKVDDTFVSAWGGTPAATAISINGATFTTKNRKAAVLVNSSYATTVAASGTIGISGVPADTTNLVWVDEASAARYNLVTVSGATKAIEPANYVASVSANNAIKGYYETLQAAINAAVAGDTVTLLANVAEAVVINSAAKITLDGQGMYGVSAPVSNKHTALKITASNADVELKNITVGDTTNTGRAVNIYNAANVKLAVTDSRLYSTIYTLNVYAEGAGSVGGVNIAVTNSTISGYAALNLWGAGGNVDVVGSTLAATNTASYTSTRGYSGNDFGVIVLESAGTANGAHASGYTVTVTDSTIAAGSVNGNHQDIVLYNPYSADNTVRLNGCTIERGTAVAACGMLCELQGTTGNSLYVKNTTDAATSAIPVLPEGYAYSDVDADGYRQVVSANYVAQVGTTKYESLQAALDAISGATGEVTVELLADATLDLSRNGNVLGGANVTKITIDGNGNKLTFNQTEAWAQVNTANNATLVLNNMSLTNTIGFTPAGNALYVYNHDISFNCVAMLNNVTSAKALAFWKNVTLDTVTVAETQDAYSIWIHTTAATASIKDLVVNTTAGRGIKVDDAFVNQIGGTPTATTVTINGAAFTTKDKKAAVLVSSSCATTVAASGTIDITGVPADTTNLVWVDEASATKFDLVTVTGATVAVEPGNYVAAVSAGTTVKGYYTTLVDAVAAANAADGAVTIELLADLDFSEGVYAGYKWAGSTYNPLEITNSYVTLDLGGHTISNMGNCALVFGHILAKDGGIANCTIKNGTLSAGTTSGALNSYVLGIAGVDGMTIKNVTTLGGINVYTVSQDVVIDSCNVQGTKYYTVCSQCGSEVTIKGTTYTKNTDQTVASKAMFWVQGAGTDSDVKTDLNPTGAFGASSITIEDGTFTVDTEHGGEFYLTGSGKVPPTVKGGAYNVKDPVEPCLVEGYVLLQSGSLWVVEEVDEEKGIEVPETEGGSVVAEITVDTTSDAVKEFLAASEDGKTIEEALTTESANGLMGWQNYVLGQDPSKELTVETKTTGDKGIATIGTTFTAPEATANGFQVSYTIETTKVGPEEPTVTQENTSASVNLATDLASDNVSKYNMTMTVVMKKDDVAVTQTVNKVVGVMKVASDAKLTIVAVPWKSLGSGDIKVNELLHTGNRSAGDRLYAYDTVNKDYAAGTWELNNDKTWVPVGVTALKNNTNDATQQYADENMTIKRGQGVWLERVDETEPIYLLGQVTDEAATAELEAGTPAEPSWNLVASPAAEALDVTTLATAGADDDQIIVPTAGAPVNYTVRNGEWGYWKPVKDTDGIVRKVWTTTDVKVPAGTGFWYLNGSAKEGLGL